ncbi:hypothetical protein [Sphingomonas hengshuiensis]|uniref:Uncharacterized protein n=1 Tax=Sphingomonas hengshuiensis TaxID=1609977 RepID=A0A7U5HVN0_9SPHN|nr:hypothetical protein [Sphingomonas hengshuiensis]AJP74552.1 hypothetical protein TS85_14865 [Sphingomonas hengshuiensis]
MTDDIDWIARAGARAKGKRPDFLGDPTSERMLSILLAVAGEVSVLRERLDTVERLLDAKGTIDRADIDAYRPDPDAAYQRSVLTKDYIARIMRGVQQDMESMRIDEKPLAEVSAELREG